MSRSSRSAVLVVALAGLTLSCGSNRPEQAIQGDPGYVFDAMVAIREGGLISMGEPRSLAQALPNRVEVFDGEAGQVRSTWSDVVVVGEVTGVRPGDAIVYDHPEPGYEGNEEEAFHHVPFDHPGEASRHVFVTIDVAWSEGDPLGETVEMRMGVLSGADPQEFLAGLRAMGDVVVVMDTSEDGRSEGDYLPVMLGGALLGQVGPDGALSFPGLGRDEARVVGDIDTVDELRSQAEEPVEVSRR